MTPAMKREIENPTTTMVMLVLLLFQVQDTAFTEAGRVGLWTKADAVTWFNDFTVQLK